MSCCAPGTEMALEAEQARDAGPRSEEILLASRTVGEGVKQTDLSVPGVHCGACIQTIESALGKLDGVVGARVNLSTKRVSVKWRDGELPPIIDTLNRLGYAAHLFDSVESGKDPVLSQLIRAVAISGFAASNIMLLSVSVWSGAEDSTRDLFHWLSALIALPALVFAGGIFYSSAWNALRHGRMNMDVPIALGVSLAYGLSIYETINSGQHAYFDASVSLLFFLLIGRTLDHVMRERARTAVKGLARLAPRGALVVAEDSGRDYLPLQEVTPGMKLVVAAGERIPVDGVVMTGASELDCSMATGESAPQPVKPGSDVRAGMLNLTQPLVMESTATADTSFLAEMMRLMEAAEGGRAHYRRLADRASALYSPVVHATAFITFLGWMAASGDWHRAITIAIAVLIITCPCALGLAVPIVQVVAARRLFENGIMVKDGAAMERFAQIDTAVFDKTGTLTLGIPELRNLADIDPQVLAIAASVASHSRHPFSRAILRAAGSARATTAFDSVEEVPGLGIEARSGDTVWRLGRAGWSLGREDAHENDAGGTVLSRNGEELAAFRFEDRLRPDAKKAVAFLQKNGVSVEIISGDSEEQVRDIAEKLGVERFQAGVLPGEKLDRMRALAAEGRKVLMVGDGLNDAPALAAAHVSMAPATAADIGRNAADFVFLRDNMLAVPLARDVSRRAGRLIRQNFGLAIIYNLLAVPIAVLGYVTPLVAAVAMSLSSLIVIGNALRLRTDRRLVGPAEAKAPTQGHNAPLAEAAA
ncbi:cadmium-translocating P-type ATPase [Nitratireductor aquibiodomus]|uniref:cation-translocating P-type ATPase n=1 Tax=Nitratireductor aquibiodomus TaxID=204799 RepID=UPI0019D3D855|nr:cation-translocating P-type ATPase [Nitratireductor aquibiodomus]MBN7763230.1 cadmium-translocating P-type ATPase [Nitratireductor aquibiodomus]